MKPTTDKRFVVSGPHGDRRSNPYRWTVVDTDARNMAVDACRLRADAVASAKELNARQAAAEAGRGALMESILRRMHRRSAPWDAESQRYLVGYDPVPLSAEEVQFLNELGQR